MKKAALGAMDASKPVAVMFGAVISADPLRISVEQKMTLEMPQLVLTRNVSERTIEMAMDHWTESETEHRHAYRGRKPFALHGGLAVGDEVILLRVQGGQKFVVLDRMG